MALSTRKAIIDTINALIEADCAEEVHFRAFSGLECRTDWWSLLDMVECHSLRDFILYREGAPNCGRWTLVEVPE